jgi:excisionase family DNA binding protein
MVGNVPVELDLTPLLNELAPAIQLAIATAISQLKQQESYLTRQQAAEILGITLPTLDKYTKKGVLQLYRLGDTDTLRYKASELEQSWNEVKYKA